MGSLAKKWTPFKSPGLNIKRVRKSPKGRKGRDPKRNFVTDQGSRDEGAASRHLPNKKPTTAGELDHNDPLVILKEKREVSSVGVRSRYGIKLTILRRPARDVNLRKGTLTMWLRSSERYLLKKRSQVKRGTALRQMKKLPFRKRFLLGGKVF